MHYNLIKKKEVSFLNIEKDFSTILTDLLSENSSVSKELKSLLLIQKSDALDEYNTNEEYIKIIDNYDLADLKSEGYIRVSPTFKFKENEKLKSYIQVIFDEFVPTDNPKFRDNMVVFNIICPNDEWDLGNERVRPIKIAGLIDSVMNGKRLSGIGKLNFARLKMLPINEIFGGYSLMYVATHGDDDKIPAVENIVDNPDF